MHLCLFYPEEAGAFLQGDIQVCFKPVPFDPAKRGPFGDFTSEMLPVSFCHSLQKPDSSLRVVSGRFLFSRSHLHHLSSAVAVLQRRRVTLSTKVSALIPEGLRVSDAPCSICRHPPAEASPPSSSWLWHAGWDRNLGSLSSSGFSDRLSVPLLSP